MRSYKKVIEERYDKQRYDGRGIKNNMYAPVNPIGFYGEFKAAQILKDFVLLLNKRGILLDELKICDCGCGDGIKTRFMAELLGNPNQVYGVEYSKNRIQHCKNMNSSIHYEYMDLTQKGEKLFDTRFDGITAFVVFMHFESEKEIMNALNNIHNALNKDGLFLWYESNVKSHWDGKKKDVDGWGFSASEMDQYASDAGFKLLKQFGVYTQIPIVNKSTVYMARDVKNIWALELLEQLPFKKNNNIRIYCRK